MPAALLWALLSATSAGVAEPSRWLDFNDSTLIRRSDDGERVESLIGCSSTTFDPHDPSAVVAELWLPLDLGASHLGGVESRAFADGAQVEYLQLIDGRVVENASLLVNLDCGGHVVHALNSTIAAPALPPPSITPAAAAALARAYMLRHYDELIDCFRIDTRSEPRIEVATLPGTVPFANRNRIAPVYHVGVTISFANGGGVIVAAKSDVIVDGVTGSVIRSDDGVQYASHRARVFNPNPVTACQTPMPLDLPPTLLPPYVDVLLQNLDEPQQGCLPLCGRFACVVDLEAPHEKPPCLGTAPFIVRRGTADFAAAMAYYHVDRLHAYLARLGLGALLAEQVQVDVAAFGGTSAQAQFVRQGGKARLRFGEQEPFVAEDAHVIAHEYAHAIQEAQAGNLFQAGPEPSAIGEGFADYWAMSSFADVTSPTMLACYAPWLRQLPGECTRRLDSPLRYGDFDADADPHRNGLIWSATLFAVFTRLGRDVTDRIVLRSHFNVGRRGAPPKMPLMAEAMIVADRQLFAGAHVATLCEVFGAHGLLRREECVALR